MAPPKSSRTAEDGKPELGSSKEKTGGPSSTKMRRGASHNGAAQNLKVASAPTSAPAQSTTETPTPTLQWNAFDRNHLHSYSRQHRLNTPSSFSSVYHQWVLSNPGSIGIYSPTMVRKRSAQRQNKEQLAMVVRKHFNGMGVQENDVIVDFLYKIRSDKTSKATGPNKKAVFLRK
ncbi:hypothetical protein DCS_00414 [Drechmeria coniospora]|uniref:Histone deacetylase complex subunit SAP30 Sin3 binding domain-containing protein n=1 Tax=Drechmeria coniospora TaxID=98403 RepID=A0A151GQ87_DRECN|nr:hypothetical protein DCS_00414 [Drechmeria coniospora]KYK59284.1 hypothetical protein DCS_00414 [Drechmeria coniospora]